MTKAKEWLDASGHYGWSVYRLITSGRCVLVGPPFSDGEPVVVKPIRSQGGEWTGWGCDHPFEEFGFKGTREEAIKFADSL